MLFRCECTVKHTCTLKGDSGRDYISAIRFEPFKNTDRRNMAEILPIRRKTLSNQSFNQ